MTDSCHVCLKYTCFEVKMNDQTKNLPPKKNLSGLERNLPDDPGRFPGPHVRRGRGVPTPFREGHAGPPSPEGPQLNIINPKEIVLHKIIGEGSFGRVWSGRWRSSRVSLLDRCG